MQLKSVQLNWSARMHALVLAARTASLSSDSCHNYTHSVFVCMLLKIEKYFSPFSTSNPTMIPYITYRKAGAGEIFGKYHVKLHKTRKSWICWWYLRTHPYIDIVTCSVALVNFSWQAKATPRPETSLTLYHFYAILGFLRAINPRLGQISKKWKIRPQVLPWRCKNTRRNLSKNCGT